MVYLNSHRVNIAQNDVKGVYRLHALDLRWLVWVVAVDVEGEIESATLIHA